MSDLNRWNYKVQLGDVFHNEDMTFEQRRDAISLRLKMSIWYRQNQFGELPDLCEELAATTDADEFDAVWDAIYDLADLDRAWIDTFAVAR